MEARFAPQQQRHRPHFYRSPSVVAPSCAHRQQADRRRNAPCRAVLRRAATIELDWDVRQKSRFDTTDSRAGDRRVPAARHAVRGGDVLVAEDGSLVA